MTKLIRLFSIPVLAAMTVLAGCSDSKQDEPAETNAACRPYGTNLKNASSLITYSANDSRAIEGEYGRALYQVLPDGTIETVLITFTEDEDGNKLIHENSLSIDPEYIFTTDNFILLYHCSYFDKDSDIYYMPWASSSVVMNDHILINKRTNKLYALDNLAMTGDFSMIKGESKMIEETAESLLLITPNGNVYRMTFSGNEASAIKVNNRSGFINPNDYIRVNSGETIYSLQIGPNFGTTGDLAILYPNGGYDILHADEWTHYHLLNDGSVLCSSYSVENEEFTISSVSISQNNPTSYSTLASTQFPYSIINGGYCEGTTNVVFMTETNHPDPNNYYVVLDKTDNSMRTIPVGKDLDLSPLRMFGGRCWQLRLNAQSGNVSMNWFNPDTFETGSFPFTVNGLDIIKVTEDYESGIIVVNGTLRADGSHCVATMNLSNAKCEIVATAPNHTSITLIPLN